MKVYLLLILTFFSPFSAFSQVEDYKINNLSSDEGLPTDNILYTYQDSYGYLWMASFEGLFRWDGHSYKRYYAEEGDNSSLAGNIVYTILEDKKKRLWIGTIGGLNLYDRENDQFIQCQLSKETDKIPINAIQVDSSNRLWLGTSYGLCKYEHDNGKAEWFNHDPEDGHSLSNDIIFSLSIDQEENIWIGTFEGGVNKFSPAENTFSRFLHEENNPSTICSNKIKSILADHEGNIWVGSYDKGLTLLNNQGEVIRHYQEFNQEKGSPKALNIVSCIYEDKNHTIWVGMEREILQYKEKGSDSFLALQNTPYKNADLSCQFISSICEDSFGNIWFASQNKGLFQTNIYKNLFRHVYKKTGSNKGLNDNVVTSIYEDEQKTLWIGTGEGLTSFSLKDNAFRTFTTKDDLSSDAIHDIKKDIYGNLWLATWSGGIIKFDPVTHKTVSFSNDPQNSNSLSFNNVKTILPQDTLLWIGTHGEGLSVYDLKNQRFINQKNNTRFPFNLKEPAWINHLFLDSKNRLWISTYGGLYLYDQKRLTHFLPSESKQSISSGFVNMVSEDSKNQVWVISESGGLDLYNEKTRSFTNFSEKYGLPKSLKAITFDRDGKIWLSSNEGLFSFQVETEKIARYGKTDGLQGNSFYHKAILTGKDGSLYFGGPNGMNFFHPDSLDTQEKKFNHTVYLTNLYIYDQLQTQKTPESPLKKVLSFTDTLFLQPNQSFFSIGYNALNLYAPTKTQYAYKLEGLHNNWINTGYETKASFTNLDPGSYLFKVRYTDQKGEWHEAEKQLQIVVLPPWYKTWWFKILVVLSAISGVIGIFYLRLASIQKQNKLLETEVAHRTQELSEANHYLVEKNEEIKLQNEKLEEYNHEILRQSEKILLQQEENIAQNQKLEQIVAELHTSNQTKDRFFSILAHDLRNPVAALSGVAETLKLNLPNLHKKGIQEYVESIYKSSQSVYNLLINLLSWSRTQSREIEYAPIDFDISPLISKNIALLEPQFRNKDIQVKFNNTTKHNTFADYNMVDAVIRNLLSNSIKFTHYKGEVEVICEEKEQELFVKVKDNGIGISESHLTNLFQIEKKALAKGTAGETGTGLGLVITKEFVEANKGTINVHAEEGKGSTFAFSLPKSTVQTNNSSIPEAPQTETEPAMVDFPIDKLLKIKGRRVLIIDDNKELRTYLRLNLSGTFEIFEAENGNEGLKMALEVQPTVIITDLMMPVMDGEQFCREVKRLPATSHIPVILLTSQSYEEGQLSGYGAGADVYLSKPVKKELLLQVIYNFIQNQEKVHQHMMDSGSFYPDDVAMNKVDEDFLNQVIHIIEENLSDPAFDYKLIGEATALSRTVLYAKIKTLTGQGVHEFIKSIRLKKSLKLLQEGKLNISQIAFEVGFNSHSYFNKCFIKQYKMPPKDYVKNLRKSSVID